VGLDIRTDGGRQVEVDGAHLVNDQIGPDDAVQAGGEGVEPDGGLHPEEAARQGGAGAAGQQGRCLTLHPTGLIKPCQATRPGYRVLCAPGCSGLM
jgi:hypothetical protein